MLPLKLLVLLTFFFVHVNCRAPKLRPNWLANSNSSNCYGVLDKKCVCNHFIINCTNVGYTQTEILLSISHVNWPQLDTIILTGNKFETLDQFLFGVGTRHKKLKYLDLSNNSVVYVDPKAFDNLPLLEHLILNNNNLSTSKNDPRAYQYLHQLPSLQILELENAFNKSAPPEDLARTVMHTLGPLNKLSKVEYLHLKNNSITFFYPDTFCNLVSLQFLYLQNNRLESIGGDVINEKCTPSLSELYVNNNSLSRLSRFSFEQFDSDIHLNKISFANNPFDCYCELNAFVKWYKKNAYRMLNKNETRCRQAYPDIYVNRSLIEIPDNGLRCESERSADYLHGVYVVCGLAIVGLCLVLFCLFYSNRRLVFNCTKQSRNARLSNLRVTSNGYQILGKEPEVKAEMV